MISNFYLKKKVRKRERERDTCICAHIHICQQETEEKKRSKKEREERKGVIKTYDPLFIQIITTICMPFLMTHSIYVTSQID
jgi:hypothetical protein